MDAFFHWCKPLGIGDSFTWEATSLTWSLHAFGDESLLAPLWLVELEFLLLATKTLWWHPIHFTGYCKIERSDLFKLSHELTELKWVNPECCLRKPGCPSPILETPSRGQLKLTWRPVFLSVIIGGCVLPPRYLCSEGPEKWTHPISSTILVRKGTNRVLNAQSQVRIPIWGASFQSPISAARGLSSLHSAHHKFPVKPVLQMSFQLLEPRDQRDMAVSPMYYLCLTVWAGCTSSTLSTGKEEKTGPSWEGENFSLQSKTGH